MKEIQEKLKKFMRLLICVLILIPIYGYLTFYFVYPTVGVIPLGGYGWLGLLYVFYSILIAAIAGILIEEPQESFAVVFASSIFGYILGLVYLSFPAYIYGYMIYSSGLEYFHFVSISWILLFFYIILGLIGIFIGGFIRDKITY